MVTQILQLLLNGATAGTILAVPAIGLTVIFAVLRFANFAVASHATIGIAWIAEPILAFALNAVDAGEVANYLPSQATSALVQPSTGAGGGLTVDLLPWWAGALVLVGYAAVAGVLGAAITLRRDIT